MAYTKDTHRVCDQTFADGEVRYQHHAYKTNDSAAALETDGYFDVAAARFQEGVGDTIMVCYAAAGTPGLRLYLVTRTAGDIALTPSAATAIT